MHLLLGFAVLIGLVAYAFGGAVARNVVRFVLITGSVLVMAFAVAVFVDLFRDTKAESAKIPEDTPFSYLPKVPEDTQELRRMCVEWIAHPNDAPRMCFAVLERTP